MKGSAVTVTDQTNEAMLNLWSPRWGAIRDVFGTVLEKRSKQHDPNCFLLNSLATNARVLELVNDDCAVYVRELGLLDARKKCERDLLGQVEGPAGEFNGACGDFWAEMAAIRVLAKKGYREFRAIFKKQFDGTTSDYEANLGARGAHIEVKNMRSNKTVLDVFDREIRNAAD
jgi:hypothetical protein